MTFRSGLIFGVLVTLLALALGLASWWLVAAKSPDPAVSKPAPPARVAKILKEDHINDLVLTEQAAGRLGIVTVPIEQKPVQRVRAYAGEIAIPAGRTIGVFAPLAGTVKAPDGGVPEPGSSVERGQPVLLLLPLLTPESRITTASALVEAEGQVKNAEAQFDAARIAADRAQRLFDEQAGSQRSVDEAKALREVAEKTLEAARARRRLLAEVTGDIERGTAAPISLAAPEDGLLRAVTVLPGQLVPAGAPLFEVVDLHVVWVRVPLYMGDLPEVDATTSASIGALSGQDAAARVARPVPAPPTANALAGTTDLYFELPNPDGRLAPGQRVAATLTLRGQSPSLVVPWSAVIHDIQGGTWVYEQIAPFTFVRRRVQVRYVAGADAVLASGPPAGTPVVSTGAAELFGTEVGFSK